MATQRNGGTSNLTEGGTTAPGQRMSTPLPQSRERSTETGLDARQLGTADLALERATLAPRSGATTRLIAPHDFVDSSTREAPTMPAALDEEELILEPIKSVGYYSLRGSQVAAIEIPKAPRVPRLDLDPADLTPIPRAPRAIRPSRPPGPPSGRHAEPSPRHETVRTPPPEPSEAPARRRSGPPPPMQESRTLASPSPDSFHDRRSSIPAPPRIYFAPHVRSQANQWSDTGSLSLPGCSSPRHARALQRALLLALLHEPGWYDIPQGLQQRAGWLFCEGWESNSDGHAFREIDDLAIVLGLPAGGESRRLLSLAIAGVVPDHFSGWRSPSSFPPSGR